jgi:hypothetical protein
MLITYNSLWKINMGDIMAVTQIDIDEGALDQVLALSKVRTK